MENSHNEEPSPWNDDRVSQLIEHSLLKLVPVIADAVNNHNKENIVTEVDEDEDDTQHLRAWALQTRPPTTRNHLQRHQHPADILPPVSENYFA